MPRNSNFRQPGGLGANRVPLGPKNGSKRRKLPCPKIQIFDDLVVIDYSPNMEVTVMAPNHGGDLLGSILGPMGSHWVKKKVKTVKNYNAPKIRISDDPTVIDFSQKMEFTVLRPNHGGDTLGAILGPMGSHWVQKMGQNVENYLAQNWIFDDPAVIDFSKKMEFTAMASNHGGDPLGSILGPMGSNWVKKFGSKP